MKRTVLFGGVALIAAYLGVFTYANAKSLDSIEFEQANTPTEVKEAVEEIFGEKHVMVKVAKCESEFRQFNSDGSVLQGKADPRDTGVMQINKKYHQEAARKLGFNLQTLEGNLGYAKYLYEKEGTTPWNSSSSCWS